MENLGKVIISFLFDPPMEGWLFLSRMAFLLVIMVLLGGIIFFIIKSSWLRYSIIYDTSEFLTYKPFGVKKIEKQWTGIRSRLDTGLESEYKLAVIETDNMMEDTLKRMGYAGETLGERLKALTVATLPNIEEVKAVHHIRNNIVHDPDYRLSLEETKNVLEVYEKAFRDLQAF